MPQTAPTKTPTRTADPAPFRLPTERPEWEMDPGLICPAQKDKTTRELTPWLP